MPNFAYAFLVEDSHRVEPDSEFGGVKLGTLEIGSDDARSRLQAELGNKSVESLESSGAIHVLRVDVEASSEEEAIVMAYERARVAIEAFSLVEPEQRAINMSRFRPTVLPNALIVDEYGDPPYRRFSLLPWSSPGAPHDRHGY